MDVRNICLRILTRGDATGFEIKKPFRHRRDRFNTDSAKVAAV
jgi:hypothetical protein